MNRWVLGLGAGLIGVAVGLGSTEARGQPGASLPSRVAASPAERLAFRFDVDPDVTVCDDGFHRGDEGGRQVWGRWAESDRCSEGPLEVVILRDGRQIRALEIGPVGRASRDEDLGRVDAGEAAAWLLSVHEQGAPMEDAGRAMAAAVMARGEPPVDRILAVARDRGEPAKLRRDALFWSSEIAAEGIDATLLGIAGDAAEDQEVRDAAIFALSRRPEEQSVPVLMDLARTAPHARTRKTALFWLSQADDDRVPEFFAELILGAGG